MRYHNITKCDMNNGDGLRVVLWVSGCNHQCKNCQNPETWSHDEGLIFDENAKQELFDELDKDYISGITFSGGDPLSYKNRKEVLNLIKEIKEKYNNKNIWVYTGFLFEQVKESEDIYLIKNIDVMVDDRYSEQLSIPSPMWRGSSNQRVIDVKETLKQNKVILYCK